MQGLGTRLDACLSEISESRCMADVGCDHGKLSVAAILSGRTKRSIATDISSPSLKKAKMLAEATGTDVDCRLSNGLTAVKENEVDTVVIAGMGGNTIVQILEDAPFKYKKYVLVPHKHAITLRKYMRDAGMRKLKDYTVKEGKHWYSVIVADYSGWNDVDNCYIGAKEETSPEYVSWRLSLVNKLLKLSSDDDLRREKEILEKYDDNK